MTATHLTLADLELARQIANRRGYLMEPRSYPSTISLEVWHRRRLRVIAELSTLEKEAIAGHGTVAALLSACGLPTT